MRQLLLLTIIVFFVNASYSQPYDSNSELRFTKAVSRELGKVDGYLEHLPPGYNTTTKKYPLLVYLHGTGERGNGSSELYRIANVGCPSRRVEENGSLCFTVNGVEECFIVISPQLNPGENWTAANQEPFWQHVLDNAGYRIDKERVYLTGHSLGGIGVWEEAYDDRNSPNRFAAIAPLSYKIGTSKICKVADKKIPVWGFCGEDDSYFSSAQGAINTLRNCPGRDLSVEIKFTAVPDAGHSITGPTYRVDHSVYNPNVYEWLLSKKRGSGSSTQSVPATPASLQAIALGSSSVAITWNDNSSNEDGFIIQRSTTSGTGFVTLTTLGANEASFVDNGLTPSTTYYYKLFAFNEGGNSAFTGQVSTATSSVSSSSEGSSITWVNINGAVQQNDDLESTAPSGWGNSGAGSGQSIAANTDGWIEMAIEDQSKADLVFGLSDANVNDHVASTDHGFELSMYNNAYWTRENSERTYLGVYEEGDILRVERLGSTILYKKNGAVVATTNVSSRPSLVADAALLNTGSTVFNGKISSKSQVAGYIRWVNIHGGVQRGNDLESTAPSGWGNSGAGSSQSIPSNSDGWIEMLIEDQLKADLAFGLSDVNPDDKTESIDFGFELSKYNNAYWTRENTTRIYVGTYAEGDWLRIERSGTKIIYKKNSAIVATTNVSSRPLLIADAALLNNGSTVFQSRISSAGSGARALDEANGAVDEVITAPTEHENEQDILIYPNPIGENGLLNINMAGDDPGHETRFLLYNLHGMLLIDQAINSSSAEISLQSLPKSTYIYRLIQDGRQVKSGRLIR